LLPADRRGCIAIRGNWGGPDLVLSSEFETEVFKEVFSRIAGTTIILRQYNNISGARAQLFGTTKFTRK